MVISTQGSVPTEEVAADLGDSPRWFQLYWSKDDEMVASFVERAKPEVVLQEKKRLADFEAKHADLARRRYLRSGRGCC